MYHYSKHTNELIVTDKPAAWMGSTDIAPPEFDKQTSSAFFEDGAWVVEYVAPEPDTIRAEVESRTQQRLDDFARTRGYESMLSACTYATDPNPRFATEGQYCVEVRGATWGKLYEILDEVLNELREIPSGYEDIEPELPILQWPE